VLEMKRLLNEPILNESFEAYRLRRSEEAKATRLHLQGSIFFESVKLEPISPNFSNRVSSTLSYHPSSDGKKENRVQVVKQSRKVVRTA